MAGGSDDDSGEVLTKEDYIAQANEICSGVSDDLDSLESEFTEAFEAKDYEAAADVLSEGNDMVVASVEEVKDLTPPEEDQETGEPTRRCPAVSGLGSVGLSVPDPSDAIRAAPRSANDELRLRD